MCCVCACSHAVCNTVHPAANIPMWQSAKPSCGRSVRVACSTQSAAILFPCKTTMPSLPQHTVLQIKHKLLQGCVTCNKLTATASARSARHLHCLAELQTQLKPRQPNTPTQSMLKPSHHTRSDKGMLCNAEPAHVFEVYVCVRPATLHACH